MIFCVPSTRNVVFSSCYWNSLLPLIPLIMEFYNIASKAAHLSGFAPTLATESKQSVTINGTLSAPAPLLFGVPQSDQLGRSGCRRCKSRERKNTCFGTEAKNRLHFWLSEQFVRHLTMMPLQRLGPLLNLLIR